MDAVLRRLEEDKARSKLTRGAAPRAPVVAPTSDISAAASTTGAPADAPELETATSAAPKPAAGGAGRTASLLKSVQGGRSPYQEAPVPMPVELPATSVESAVSHPAAGQPAAPVAPRAPAGAPPARPAPRGQLTQAGTAMPQMFPVKAAKCAPDAAKTKLLQCQEWVAPTASTPSTQSKSIMELRTNPDNFTHILRFMRDGKSWQAPEDAGARESLREEALYFGASALVNHLDRLGSGYDGAAVAVEGSAMATDLAELGLR